MILTDLLTRAKKVNNYIVDATDNAATNLKWTSTTQQTYTVPTAKRWFLLGGTVILDQSGTCVVYQRDSAGASIALLCNYSAGTGAKSYPNYTVASKGQVIMDAGEDIYITCGVAQGAGAKASCVVLEVKT